jgi:K+-transporting ATPase ATPase C chain
VKQIKISVLLFMSLYVLTGILYPAAVTVVSQAIFPNKSSGSLIYRSDGKPAGSELIGQLFSDPKYFWPRPSATADFPYNAMASGGSNLGPTNKDLIDQVAGRVKSFRESGIVSFLPADLVAASGSGLDPHISEEGALLQVPRVARQRRLPEEKIRDLVKNHIEGRQLGFLGEPRVNVLLLNLALDKLKGNG